MSDALYTVSEAGRSDLDAVLAVQHDAFGRVAAELDIVPEHLPPLQERVGDLGARLDAGWRFFAARAADGRIIGTVRSATCSGDPLRVEIGRLAVASGWQRRGVARALMSALEASYPEARAFELFTGHDAYAPLALYESLGYERVRSEIVGDGYELVWLEKLR